MVTKWKNRWVVIAWLLLFTHGVSGIMMGLSLGRDYINKDYFRSDSFESKLHHFIDVLTLFELNYIPKEEAKKLITITDEDIQEHRFRYGNLDEQIANIHAQYEGKIQEAKAANKQQVVDAYISERDKKIEDIAMNFKSDEHIRPKVVKEKEQRIDEYYREIENQRAEFINYQSVFLYQFKNTETGQLYTNLNSEEGINTNKGIHTKDMAFVRTFPSAKEGYLNTEGRTQNLDQWITGKQSGVFEGQIAIPKSAIAANTILPEYTDFQHRKMIFYSYTITALLAFTISLYLLKKIPILPVLAPERWQSFYNRVPIDVGGGVLLFSGLLTMLMLGRDHPFYLYEYAYDYFTELLFDLVVNTAFVALTLGQGKYLMARLKSGVSLRADMEKSLVFSGMNMIKETFRIRQVGTQVFILLTIAFSFGAGLIIAFMEPFLFLFYAPGFVLIGLPALIFIMKRTGYLNQIVLHTNELADGYLEPDLPILGKSILATLANNINQLKYGVKTSQKEQAKSERLKTELITNVSHDLRTPLTSIITYTELLKTPELTSEEREAYLEIIDRKSKRLKVLIDDLFEASKMASGSVELVKERVDVVQLLQQALAEYNDQINHSTLQFRINTPDAPVYALVDGQKLWRVFDNLIGNILKYSLENTRVYISVHATPSQIHMTFKNVAKYELGENVDELFERFKRGDSSRQTDGSGLGLAIAKSIVDLHDGNLAIEVDGDLFKVIVTINTK